MLCGVMWCGRVHAMRRVVTGLNAFALFYTHFALLLARYTHAVTRARTATRHRTAQHAPIPRPRPRSESDSASVKMDFLGPAGILETLNAQRSAL